MAGKKPATETSAAEEPKVDTRGEISVPLDGQDYVLRPSREAIQKIERQTRPLLALVQAAEVNALTLDEMAICTVEMMKAYGAANPDDALASDYRGAKVEKVADLIYEAGLPRVNIRLLPVLSGALFGGYTASGEVKAAETTSQ